MTGKNVVPSFGSQKQKPRNGSHAFIRWGAPAGLAAMKAAVKLAMSVPLSHAEDTGDWSIRGGAEADRQDASE